VRIGVGARWVVALACAFGAPAAGIALQTSIGGRTIDLDMLARVREVVEQDRDTTHELTMEQLRVHFAATLTDWLRFDSTTTGTHGGPVLSSDPSGIYNLDDAFESLLWSVEFDEVFFDIRLADLDVRVGKQKVSWGKLDRFQPTDFINPYAYNDPFVLEEAERKIGIPALQASYYLPQAWNAPPESRVTMVWVPQYFPFRFPPSQCVVQNGTSQCTLERWFPPAAVPPTTFTIPAGAIDPRLPAISVPLGFQTSNIDPPAFRLENSGIGLRASAFVNEVDTALYFYHGFDSAPSFALAAEAFGQADPMSPIGVSNLSARTILTPHFQSIDAGGADFSYAFGSFTARGEGAFVHDRAFPRDLRNLTTNPQALLPAIGRAITALQNGAGQAPVDLPSQAFEVRDAVEWGLGADYLWEGYLFLLQVNQTDVLNNDVQLLIENVDTRLLANFRKSFFSDTLRTQLVALYAIESDYTLLRPLIGYQITDHLLAQAGYLFIAGRSQTVIGEFKNNKEAWFQIEYRL
jgi:uncharacterized protein DUF1302